MMKTKPNRRKDWRNALRDNVKKEPVAPKSLCLKNLMQTNIRLLKSLDISNAVLF